MEDQKQDTSLISIILRATVVISVAISLAWLAIWNGIKFSEYTWTYSTDSSVKALQYLLHGLWGISMAISPAWWIGGIVLSVRLLDFKSLSK